MNDFRPGTTTEFPQPPQPSQGEIRDHVHLRFSVPKGKVSSLMGMMNLLQRKFGKLTLDIRAEDGGMTAQEYELNIQETLEQLGIESEE